MAPVERKVTAATVATYLGSALAASILQAVQDGSLVAALPPPVAAAVVPVVPALVAFVSGYATRHTPRPSELRELVRREVAWQLKRELDRAPTAPVPTARHRLDEGPPR